MIDVYGHYFLVSQGGKHHTVTLVCKDVVPVARYVALPCVVWGCVGIVGKLDYILDVLVPVIVLAVHYVVVVGIPPLTA